MKGDKKIMKKNPKILRFVGLMVLMVFLTVFLSSCGKEEKETDRYSFWRGDIENFYYILDMNDQPLHKVMGKPFMIFEYDPINGYPIEVEFGLYEARNEYLPRCEGAIPEPFLSADQLEYAKRLGITGSVDLLCNWYSVTSSSELPSGDFEFSVDKGENFWGHEILHFTHTTGLMDGEIINDSATWGGRISDSKAFHLVHLFNSNTSY